MYCDAKDSIHRYHEVLAGGCFFVRKSILSDTSAVFSL